MVSGLRNPIVCGIRCYDGLGVLDLAGGGGRDPAVVNWGDNVISKDNQKWFVSPVPGHDDYVSIKSEATGHPLIGGPDGSSLRCEPIEGHAQELGWWTLHDNTGQIKFWDYGALGHIARVTILNVKHPNVAIDLNERIKENGNRYICSRYHGGINQQFEFMYRKDRIV